MPGTHTDNVLTAVRNGRDTYSAIRAETGLSRETCGPILRALIKRGLVKRHEDGGGWVYTPGVTGIPNGTHTVHSRYTIAVLEAVKAGHATTTEIRQAIEIDHTMQRPTPTLSSTLNRLARDGHVSRAQINGRWHYKEATK